MSNRAGRRRTRQQPSGSVFGEPALRLAGVLQAAIPEVDRVIYGDDGVDLDAMRRDIVPFMRAMMRAHAYVLLRDVTAGDTAVLRDEASRRREAMNLVLQGVQEALPEHEAAFGISAPDT